MDLIISFRQGHAPQNTRSQRVTLTEHHEIIIVENLSLKYKDDLWFSSQEMNSFRHQNIMMLRSILSTNMNVEEYAELNIQETSVFMGLENYLSRDVSQEIGYRTGAIVSAVLSEQQCQWDIGIHDSEIISFISEALSEQSRLCASFVSFLHAD